MFLISKTSGRVQVSGLCAFIRGIQSWWKTHLGHYFVDLSCNNLPKFGFVPMKHTGSFYLCVSIDSQVERLGTLKAGRSKSAKWDNDLYLCALLFNNSIIPPKLMLPKQ
jgi:hypothetical protein